MTFEGWKGCTQGIESSGKLHFSTGSCRAGVITVLCSGGATISCKLGVCEIRVGLFKIELKELGFKKIERHCLMKSLFS